MFRAFWGVDRLGGQDQLQGSAAPDDAGQPLRAAAHGDQAEGGLGEAEAGSAGGDADIAGQGQLQPGAKGVAVNRADDGSWQLGQAGEGVARQALGAGCGQKLPVPAGGEDARPAAAADDDHAHLLIVGQERAGVGQPPKHQPVDGVIALGSLKRQVSDGPALVQGDGCMGPPPRGIVAAAAIRGQTSLSKPKS